MTIVPREWDRLPVSAHRRPSPSMLDVSLLALGVVCVVVGIVLLARGHGLGLAALTFGAGYFARSFAEHRGRRLGDDPRHQ